MVSNRFWFPPRPLTIQSKTLIRSFARQMALASLGPDDRRVDALAGQLAYQALSYARHGK